MTENEVKTASSIIVDGADQQGKTTFAAKLAKWMEEIIGKPVEVIHFVKSKAQDQVGYYTNPLLRADGPFVIDRNYVSELVYGPLFRGKSAIDDSDKSNIEMKYDEANAFVVILKRKNYKWEERDEMYTKDDNLKIIKGFDDVYDSISIDKMKVDAFDEESVRMVIQHWIEKNKLQ